ncbi:MAG: HAMP domain-containing histidine kinase [Methylacidiphilales bacterium]|nr:HAMP domain-containing histidine kinase [Candidatus Methylacidiphilales bacterium]
MDRRYQALLSKENTEKITQVQNELEAKELSIELSRIKDEIYPGILHDILSPLTTVKTQAELLQELIQQHKTLDTESKKRFAEFTYDIIRETERASEISRRYLGLFNPTQTQPTSLNQVLADIENVFRIHPASKKHTLRFHPTEDIHIKISRTDLFQILYNIIENACRSAADPDTPLTIEIKPEILMQPIDMSLYLNTPTQIFINRLTFANRAPLVALHIKDNGQGIPPNILERIFEPYFSTKPQGTGTGLGLAVVERLLRAAEGGVFVRTEPGQGTTFSLFIPATEIIPQPLY